MKSILIIEDDSDWGSLVRELLIGKGYDAFVVNDPKNGIKAAQEQKPDLVLMDIVLPGIDGAEAVKLLQANPVTKNIPVVFLTGLLSDKEEDYRKRGLNVNNIHYPVVSKPVDVEELIAAIEKAFKK